MDSRNQLAEAILHGWKINNLVDIKLLNTLVPTIWSQRVPGYQRKTVRMIGAHMHNCRCYWIKVLGRKWKIKAPTSVNEHQVSTEELITALNKSSKAMEELLRTGLQNQDTLPGFPLGAVHFAQYMISHEAHHRGQLIMASRQLGHPLPVNESGKLWQWSRL